MFVTLRKQKGFSLPELMIGSLVGLIVVSGVIALYVNTISSSSDNLRAARLNQDLRAIMSIMVKDIRRAGYWAAQPGIDDLSTNPFFQDVNDIQVSDVGGFNDACITYAYDLDKDKLVGDGTAGATMEQFGLRRSSHAVQLRSGGNVFSCDEGDWEDLTDTNTEITDLSFVMNETCLNVLTKASTCPCATGDPCQIIRQVDITLAGRLGNDEKVRKTVTESVRVRNDKFVLVSP